MKIFFWKKRTIVTHSNSVTVYFHYIQLGHYPVAAFSHIGVEQQLNDGLPFTIGKLRFKNEMSSIKERSVPRIMRTIVAKKVF